MSYLSNEFFLSPHVRQLFLRKTAPQMDSLDNNAPHSGEHLRADSLSEDIRRKIRNIQHERTHDRILASAAVVALGVPLYQQLETIKKQFMPILMSELAGCLAGIISVVLIAKALGASKPVIMSLAPKSVTTPIAMEVTKSIGGIPSLTAAVVVCVGLLCAVAGYKTMGFARVNSPVAQGLSMGTAAHAMGTATSMDVSKVHGAYASLDLRSTAS